MTREEIDEVIDSIYQLADILRFLAKTLDRVTDEVTGELDAANDPES